MAHKTTKAAANGKRGGGGRRRRGDAKPKARVTRGARSQVLPGIDLLRARKLDNLCEAIAECRAQKNAAVTEEKSLDVTALRVMVETGIAVYRHGGVELARIPGAEKLRVRMTTEEGEAGAEDLEPPEPEQPWDLPPSVEA